MLSVKLRDRLAVALALLFGLYVSYEAPEVRPFEQAMRSLGITGAVLQPLSLLAAALSAFLAMVVTYVAVGLALDALHRATASRASHNERRDGDALQC